MIHNLDILLLNPLYIKERKHFHLSRDTYGGEPPGSLIYPPLDLAYLAAELLKSKFRVKLIDANALHFSHNFILQIVAKERPRFVCIPSAWESLENDILLAKMIKDINSEIQIILSGPNVTADPKRILNFSNVDFAILGELEKPVLQILMGDIKYNIAYRNNGNIVVKERRLMEQLDELPLPARGLLPNDKYVSPFTRTNPFTTMNISRGCSYTCIFCPHNIWDLGKVRFRSIENIIEELEIVVNQYKIRQVIFVDSTFTLNRELLKGLCDKIIKKGIQFFWRCFARVDTVDKDLLCLMKRAGCHQICYGFESGSQRILNLNDKKIDIGQSKKAALLTKEVGIEIAGTFMVGLLGESEDTLKETLDFAIELDPDFAQFNIALPVPSTKFFGLAKSEEENKQPEDFLFLSTFGRDSLSEFKRLCYKRFYLRPSYLLKRLKNIQNFHQLYLQLKTAANIFTTLN